MNSTHPLAKRKTRGKRVHEFHPPFGQEESKSGKVASIPPTLAPRGKLTHNTHEKGHLHSQTIASTPAHQKLHQFHPPLAKSKARRKKLHQFQLPLAKRKARRKKLHQFHPHLRQEESKRKTFCVNSTRSLAKRKARGKKVHRFHPSFRQEES